MMKKYSFWIYIILFLILSAGCSESSRSDNQIYNGVDDFGYQYDNLSPYGDWISDGSSAASHTHFGYVGVEGYIGVLFADTNNPIDSDVYDRIPRLSQFDYSVRDAEVVERNGKLIYQTSIEVSGVGLIDAATFEFDSSRIVLVYGWPAVQSMLTQQLLSDVTLTRISSLPSSQTETTNNYYQSFNILLDSLKPYRFSR